MQLIGEENFTYSVKEVCLITGLSRSTIYRYEKEGLVSFNAIMMVNGRRRYTQAMMDEIIQVSIDRRQEKYRAGLMDDSTKSLNVAKKLKSELEMDGIGMLDFFMGSPDGENKRVIEGGGHV